MVDEINIDDINAAEESLKRQSAATDDLSRAQIELAQAVSRSTSAYDEYRRRIGESTESINKQHIGLMSTSAASTKAATGIENLGNKKEDMGLLSSAIDVVSNAVHKVGIENMALFGIAVDVLPKISSMFDEIGTAAKKVGFNMSESFAAATPFLEKLGIKKLPLLQNAIDSATGMQILEQSFIRNATAAGDLNRVYKFMGDDFGNLEDVTARYFDSIIKVSEATGASIKQITPYAEALQKIPGALDTVINLQTKFGKNMNMMDATFKVGTALGMDHTEMYELLNTAWRTANLRGQDALEMIANIGQTAQDLNLPLDTVQERVLQTADAFKMWGDQTQSAINVLGDVRGALEDSGIGPKAIDQIVGSMLQGVEKLDVAQKAFISGATGGPGGLFGAFNIDRTLREEGGAGKVVNQVMEAMQNQFGGPVVTHEDVMNNPALSGELLKQMTFLQDVAGIAGSDIEAQRILEVMQKGGVGAEELDFAKKPENVLQSTIERGEKFAQKQRNQMTEHLRNIEIASITGAQRSLEIMRLGQDELNNLKRIQILNEKTTQALPFEREEFGQRDFISEQEDKVDQGLDKLKILGNNLVSKLETDEMGDLKDLFGTGKTDAIKKSGLDALEKVIGPEKLDSLKKLFPEIAQEPKEERRIEEGEEKTPQLAQSLGLAPPPLAQEDKAPQSPQLAQSLGLAPIKPGFRPQPLGVAPDVEDITGRGGVTERAEAARKEMEMGAATAPLPPALGEGTLKVEIDIKDGVTKIAKATVTEELKKIWGPKATVGSSGTD